MSVWNSIVGQAQVVEQLKAIAQELGLIGEVSK